MRNISKAWSGLCAGLIVVLASCAPEPVGSELSNEALDEEDGGMLDKAQGCDDRCSPSCPCTQGQGDCDSKADCAGNLVCPPDGPGIERCQAPSGGGSGGSASGGGSAGSSGSEVKSNLQVRLGGNWKGVCCSGGELEVSGGSCSWTESSRVLKTKDLRSGAATQLKCPENSQRPADCSCSSSGERMHGIKANGSVHVKNSISLPNGAPLYPNSGHETCIDLVGGKLQSRYSSSSCPNWRLRNFY